MKNKAQNKAIDTNSQAESQLARANNALKALAANVTTKDREEAPASPFTIVQYLKGRGKDLGTAMTLLEFFRKRIADRERLLAA